jgi:hypothetical protein
MCCVNQGRKILHPLRLDACWPPLAPRCLGAYWQPIQKVKKTRPAGGMMAPGILLRKKSLSRRSRKPPNLYPTFTQWHRNS